MLSSLQLVRGSKGLQRRPGRSVRVRPSQGAEVCWPEVAQKLSIKQPDPYDRPRDYEPGPVAAQDDKAPEYEIETLLGRRIHRSRGRPVVQYLVKWRGYSSASDQWYDLEDLGTAMEAVKEYGDAHDNRETPHIAASRAPRSEVGSLKDLM